MTRLATTYLGEPRHTGGDDHRRISPLPAAPPPVVAPSPRGAQRTGTPQEPFDVERDYAAHVDGKTRTAGVTSASACRKAGG
jgi:hypothetical protein